MSLAQIIGPKLQCGVGDTQAAWQYDKLPSHIANKYWAVIGYSDDQIYCFPLVQCWLVIWDHYSWTANIGQWLQRNAITLVTLWYIKQCYLGLWLLLSGLGMTGRITMLLRMTVQ